MNNKTYLVTHIMFLIFPLFVALACHPFWKLSFEEPLESRATVPLITTVLSTVISPIYLIIVNKHFMFKSQLSVVIGIIVSLIALYGSIYLQFWNWGIATGMLKNPDGVTKIIVLWEMIVSTIIFVLGMGVLFFINKVKH